jgi:hypothetical protein
LAIPRQAHAQYRSAFEVEVSGRVLGHRLAELPAFEVPDESRETNYRFLTKGARLPAGGPITTMGGGVDVNFIFGDRYRLNLLGMDLLVAAGPQQRIASNVDGSIATLRPWTTIRYDVGLLGFGARFKHRRYAWGVGLRSGFSFMQMGATLAEGANVEPLEKGVTATSVLLRAEVEGCRRLDPTRRLCVVLTPSIYDYGWGNGMSFGLRWEADL